MTAITHPGVSCSPGQRRSGFGGRSWRRLALAALVAVAVGACGGTTAPTSSPTVLPSPVVSADATLEPAIAPTERPISVERPTDVPTDGSCIPDHQCLGLLAPGSHHSENFDPAFSFSITEHGWQNREELPWVLPLLPIDYPGDALVFFRGPRVSADDGRILASVGADVPAIVAWFVANGALSVSAPADVTVGGLAGTWFDVSVAPGATNTDPGCPVRVCQAMLAGKAAGGQLWGWGLAGIEKERIYLLAAGDGTVAIVVDSIDGTSFDDLARRASAILATVKFD